MEIIVKVHKLLPLQTGEGKNGIWKKQDIIVETDATYSKKICISIWGDKIIESHLIPGNMLRIEFEIESREYNGKWYTDVRAIKTMPLTDEKATAPTVIFDANKEQLPDVDPLPF